MLMVTATIALSVGLGTMAEREGGGTFLVRSCLIAVREDTERGRSDHRQYQEPFLADGARGEVNQPRRFILSLLKLLIDVRKS